MHCRSCGADLPVDAAFCSQCGARVQLGSVLGVGTDLTPVPHDDSTAANLDQTRELPRVDPAATAPATAATPRSAAAPALGPQEPEEGPAHSRNSILAMIATFAVLTIIGTFALTRLVGADDPAPTARSTAPSPTVAEEAGDAPTASSSSSPTDRASATPEVSPSASTSIPAQARRCSTNGSDAVATAYAGTERTSCEFAGAVRDAYREAGTPGGATSLRAFSPVTKKWYSLSCDGGEPVRCTSTTNAIVLLGP